MNDEKTLKQWLLDLFQKLFDLFKGREDNYADDNELLAGMAENDEEKAAIMQIKLRERKIQMQKYPNLKPISRKTANPNTVNALTSEPIIPIFLFICRVTSRITFRKLFYDNSYITLRQQQKVNIVIILK